MPPRRSTRLPNHSSTKTSRLIGAACYALGRIGPPAARAVPEITEQLESESIYTRVSAAWALAAIDEDKAHVAKLVLPLLIEALDSDISLVQIEAAETLGDAGQSGQDRDTEAENAGRSWQWRGECFGTVGHRTN